MSLANNYNYSYSFFVSAVEFVRPDLYGRQLENTSVCVVSSYFYKEYKKVLAYNMFDFYRSNSNSIKFLASYNKDPPQGGNFNL